MLTAHPYWSDGLIAETCGLSADRPPAPPSSSSAGAEVEQPGGPRRPDPPRRPAAGRDVHGPSRSTGCWQTRTMFRLCLPRGGPSTSCPGLPAGDVNRPSPTATRRAWTLLRAEAPDLANRVLAVRSLRCSTPRPPQLEGLLRIVEDLRPVVAVCRRRLNVHLPEQQPEDALDAHTFRRQMEACQRPRSHVQMRRSSRLRAPGCQCQDTSSRPWTSMRYRYPRVLAFHGPRWGAERARTASPG